MADAGRSTPRAWPARVLLLRLIPITGNAMELMDMTMWVTANSVFQIRPTMKMKKAKPKPCIRGTL